MSIRRLFLSLILALALTYGFLALLGKTTVSTAATVAASEIIESTGSHFLMDGFTRYVAITGTDGGACSTPASACRTIQYAVDQATRGDEILVASGIYTGVQTRNGVPQIAYISETVTIRGGYNANNSFAGPSNSISNPTILDAEEQGRALYITNNASVTVEGLQITGGRAYGIGGDDWNGGGNGGGIFIITATATLSNILMSENSAYYRGGGIYAAGNLVFINTNLLSNTSEWYGGGAYVEGRAVISGGRIENNQGIYGGGGLYAGSLTLTGTQFVNNLSQNGGGASVHGNASLTNAYFEHNHTGSCSPCYGGAMYMAGNITMNGLNFVDNAAGVYGGGVFIEGGTLTVSNTTFYSNSAYGGGGAYVLGRLALTDTMFVSNTAQFGAGVSVWDGGWTGSSRLTNGVFVNNMNEGVRIRGGTVDVFNTTITKDDQFPWAVGIRIDDGTTQIINTIVASYTNGIVQSGSSAVYEDYNLFFNPIIAYTGLISHGSYSSITGTPAFAADGYHLTAISAARGKGVNAGVTADFDGELRHDPPDIGADEYYLNLPVSKVATPDPAQAGAQLTYTIRVTNNYTEDLHATITDTLPSQVTPGGILTWTPVTIISGSVWSQTVVVTVEMGYAGILTNVVQVTTEEGPTGVYTATTHSLAPSLAVSKEARPNPVQAGSQLTYTIHVTNTGTVALNGIITDTLPAHVISTGILTWPLTNLLPGDIWTTEVVGTIEMGYSGTLTNAVEVTTLEGATGIYTATSQVLVTPALSVTKDDSPDPVQASEQLTYTIRVINTGNITLTGLITDNLPARVAPTGIVTWALTSLAPTEVWTKTVVVTVEMGYAGPLTNVVQVTTLEGAMGIYTATTQADVTPALTMTKHASSAIVRAGELLTYTIRITNTGNIALNGVVTDMLPARVTPTGILTWPLTGLAPGNVWTQPVVVTVMRDYSGTLTNRAQVTTQESATGETQAIVQAIGYQVYLPVVLK